jgi:hypothetical protein
VLAYFLFSIFTIPFLLAFVIEHIQRHTQDRQQQAYVPSAMHRRHRLLARRCRLQHVRRMRRQDQIELLALRSAMHRRGKSS